jgi:hexokinase
VYRAEAYYEQLEPGTRCKPKDPFGLPVTDAITNMALEEEAKRMAAQFDYSAEDVNKGVEEFIAEMEEGLGKQGAMMSQIPT